MTVPCGSTLMVPMCEPNNTTEPGAEHVQPSDQGKRNEGIGPESIRKRRMWQHGYERPTFERAPAHGANVLVTGPVPPVAELHRLAGQGWDVYADGRYPTLRHPDGSVVRWAASWFGDHAHEAERLWPELERRLERIDHGARPIGAPATTGRDLWLRLIPEGVSYPTMPADIQHAIRSTSGQGRIQLFGPAGETIGGLYEYDARLAYTAVMRELPAGEPRFTRPNGAASAFDLDPYRPARWLVSWIAPDDWKGPGILTQMTSDGPTWPRIGEGWADGVEVHLARRFGWDVRFLDGMVWPRTVSPFERWRNSLTKVFGTDDGPWRHVYRSLVLHTIGAMYGAPRKATRFGKTAPDDATDVQLTTGGVLRWTETTPALWPATHHPEWTAAIWARARARLLDAPSPTRGDRVGALHVPPEHLVAFRTDAIYLTTDPEWPDDGRPGRYVRKRAVARPLPRPATMSELLEARNG